MAFEPGHDIGIEPKGQLLLDGPIEEAALGAGPVEKLRRVRGIDGIIAERRQRLQFCPLLRRQPLRSSLLPQDALTTSALPGFSIRLGEID